jgi:Stf0 sulphotransferase
MTERVQAFGRIPFRMDGIFSSPAETRSGSLCLGGRLYSPKNGIGCVGRVRKLSISPTTTTPIDHLVAESLMREAAIQEFFAQGRIVPLTVTYEDFISKYEETVFDILGWLGLDVATATVASPAYEQLSDALSEDWVQRFRRDKQARWKNRAW